MRALMLIVSLVLGTTTGCGDECPGGGQAGNCDFANTAADPSMAVSKLEVKAGCDYVPIDVCSGDPGFTCSLGGGDQHRHGYAVIADQAGWDTLAASWGDPSACTPGGLPADWTDTFLVLASARATSAIGSRVSHSLFRRADGTPHIKIEMEMTYGDDCDCAELAGIALVVHNAKPPAVCLQVNSVCE